MTLAQALKKRNRIVQKIHKLQQEIQQENSVRSDDPQKIKVEDLMAELEQNMESLIKIKIAIFVASVEMRENILRLSELKSLINFFLGIETREGKVNDYGNEYVEYKVVFDKLWVKNKVETCEQQIDEIQEELDQFNHTTHIDI